MPTNETIGLEDAQRAVDAAMAAASASERPFAVAVVDENGELVYLERKDGASATAVRNAERKAYTSAYIGRDTLIYRQQIMHDGRTVADWSNAGITTLHGGLTLHRASQVIGGIGVSGTGDEDRDERLALAGAEAMVKPAGDARLQDAALRPVFRSAPGPHPHPNLLPSREKGPEAGRRKATWLPGLAGDGAVSPDLVEVGGMFFTSGVSGVDVATGVMPDDPAEQFLNAWRNLRALVQAAGLSTDEIGLVTNFIDSQDFRAHINTGWLELFPDADNRPARKTTSYPLPPGMGVQLQAMGVVGERRQCIEVPGLTHRDPLPNGVRMGDYVFSSVIVPWDLTTSLPVVGEDAQTDKCFDNMRVLMEAAGGTVDDVVLQWVYLNDFAYQPYMVDVYLEAWPIGQYQAARKTFRYAMGGQVQIQVIGRIGGERTNHEIEGHGHHDPIPMGARVGDLFCSSGVSGVDTAGDDKLEPVEGAAGQAHHGLRNVESLVRAGGGTMADVGLITLLVQDYDDLPAINAEWVQMFPDPKDRPARHVIRMGVQRRSRVQHHMIAVV